MKMHYAAERLPLKAIERELVSLEPLDIIVLKAMLDCKDYTLTEVMSKINESQKFTYRSFIKLLRPGLNGEPLISEVAAKDTMKKKLKLYGGYYQVSCKVIANGRAYKEALIKFDKEGNQYLHPLLSLLES